jgi:hypothetical protein
MRNVLIILEAGGGEVLPFGNLHKGLMKNKMGVPEGGFRLSRKEKDAEKRFLHESCQ